MGFQCAKTVHTSKNISICVEFNCEIMSVSRNQNAQSIFEPNWTKLNSVPQLMFRTIKRIFDKLSFPQNCTNKTHFSNHIK